MADFLGSDAILRSLPALRPSGRVATIAGITGDTSPMCDLNITVHFVLVRSDRSALDALSAMVASGILRPIIAEVLPLEDVQLAHRRLESGQGRGKVVLRIR